MTRRIRCVCRGAVQGVGFRPAVHRLATSLGLVGWVRNDPDGAVVEVEGTEDSVECFRRRLTAELPPLARLDGLDVVELPARGESGFEVLVSAGGIRRGALVPPDAALCADCRREMEDSENRRFHYPFTTCTNCGPRFSLCRSLPYDRERTSMACFPLCEACGLEYRDPSDRRFHAEPVCCPACGPALEFIDESRGVRVRGNDAVARAREALASGRIVAVKGLGGFQLACRADDPAVVLELRERKRRPTKPFAIMVRDLETARMLVDLSPGDEILLTGLRSPVLLAPRRAADGVANEIAPGIHDLGVMLPTTPLHVELFRFSAYGALVMTSGNAGDEPICRTNREARARLREIADAFLLHDRDVVRRVDDSVVRALPPDPILVRRSRGFVPEPLSLPVSTSRSVLALGGHLQTTACVASGDQAFVSQHVGDLDTEPAREFLVEVAAGLENFLDTRAGTVVVDRHPDYPSTWIGESLAQERGAELMHVQHHLAHAAAVLAEHGRFPDIGGRCAAIVFDGTGYGPDETAWGGEWLLVDGGLEWRRLGHLEELPLVGGEKAVREPWRVAVAAVAREGVAGLLPRLPISGIVEAERLSEVARMTDRVGWPRATGAGRVFEAAGALLGLAAVNGWEGEAAARLESLAARCGESIKAWEEVELRRDGGTILLPGAALLAEGARRAAAGEDPARIALGFHVTFSRLAAILTAGVVPRDVRTIAMGGGCFVNRILLTTLTRELRGRGFEVLRSAALPPGDGGLSYGQAVVAAVSLDRGVEPRRIDGDE